jgi:hypothetical protein
MTYLNQICSNGNIAIQEFRLKSSAILSVACLLFGLSVNAPAAARVQAETLPVTLLQDSLSDLTQCTTVMVPCPVTTAAAPAHARRLLMAVYSAEQLEQDLMQLPDEQEPLDAAAAPVPEPQTLLMMVMGLLLMGFTSSRQQVYDKFTR